jgi:hypothetical protein
LLLHLFLKLALFLLRSTFDSCYALNIVAQAKLFGTDFDWSFNQLTRRISSWPVARQRVGWSLFREVGLDVILGQMKAWCCGGTSR